MALQSWALTTVAAVESAFGLEPGIYTAEIERAINTQSAVLEQLTNRRLKSRLYTNKTYDGKGEPWLTIDDYPITDVDALTIYDNVNNLLLTIDITDLSNFKYEINGFYYLPQNHFYCGVNNITTTYTAGYLSPMHDAELLILENAVLDLISINSVPGQERTDPRIRREQLLSYSVSYFDMTEGRNYPNSVQMVINMYGKHF